MENVKTKAFICKSWKSKSIAAALAVIAAVALPQLFHLLGMVSNMGTALGETFLPMHIAIFLVAFFAGPWAGLAAGALSPVASFALTTLMGSPMPTIVMLPFMVIELAVYGLATGILAGTRLPAIATLLFAQIAGRAVRALAIVIGVYAFGSPMNVAVIWNSVLAGLPGLILQWIIVPLLVYYVDKKAHRD